MAEIMCWRYRLQVLLLDRHLGWLRSEKADRDVDGLEPPHQKPRVRLSGPDEGGGGWWWLGEWGVVGGGDG